VWCGAIGVFGATWIVDFFGGGGMEFGCMEMMGAAS